MIVESSSLAYEVNKLVAETATYRLYLCRSPLIDTPCLLQIATDQTSNGALDRMAYLLKELSDTSHSIDEVYAKTKNSSGKSLGYDKLFPQLVDSFISAKQGKRRINVLSFSGVKDVTSMLPLSNLSIQKRRVDLRTSAWILGRSLKLLGMTHNERIAITNLSMSNLLIEPTKHYTVVFDWSKARMFSEAIPKDKRAEEISQVVRAVSTALGSKQVDLSDILDVDDQTRPYVEYLKSLMAHREADAERAHHNFYSIVDSIWERSYYPFHTLPTIN